MPKKKAHSLKKNICIPTLQDSWAIIFSGWGEEGGRLGHSSPFRYLAQKDEQYLLYILLLCITLGSKHFNDTNPNRSSQPP